MHQMHCAWASLRTVIIRHRTTCTSCETVRGLNVWADTVGFTTDVQQMKENLNSLFAAGGGDGPEAMTAALKAAVDLDWRADAAKMCILITDAPPHGIGEVRCVRSV